MTWKTFNGPSMPGQVFIDTYPVNLARVCYAERTRSPNDPSRYSGKLRLVFGKDFYLEVAEDTAAQAALAEALIPIVDGKN